MRRSTVSVPKFWIEQPNDETIELFIGGTSLGTFNHDEHGWTTMRSIERLFVEIAEILGVEVGRK
jgi:hypothetical protein